MTSEPSIRRAYLQSDADPRLRIPVKRVHLTGDEPGIDLYDTGGPHTDPEVTIDPSQGLSPLRADWIAERGDVEVVEQPVTAGLGVGEGACFARKVLRGKSGRRVTQLHYARRGEVTPEMQYVALREGLPVELVRDEVAAGAPSSRPTSTTRSWSR
jgi:phosphomethylpyrimidine synthase